jgi:hypothetical protein
MKPSKLMMTAAPPLAVSINDAAPTDSEIGVPASAIYALNSDGTGSSTQDTPATFTWLTTGLASQAEVRATYNSGTLSSGTTGSWLPMSSNNAWSCNRAANGTNFLNLTIEIRRASDGVVLDTATVSFTAARSP